MMLTLRLNLKCLTPLWILIIMTVTVKALPKTEDLSPVPGWRQVGIGYLTQLNSISPQTLLRGNLGGPCVNKTECKDPFAECVRICVCARGLTTRYIGGIAGTRRGSVMCFVPDNRPCRPEVFKTMVPDRDGLLSKPGMFKKHVENNKAALEAYKKTPNGKVQKQLVLEYERRLTRLEEFVKQYDSVVLGKSLEDWSCQSGKCTSGICSPGKNPFVQKMGYRFLLPTPGFIEPHPFSMFEWNIMDMESQANDLKQRWISKIYFVIFVSICVVLFSNQ